MNRSNLVCIEEPYINPWLLREMGASGGLFGSIAEYVNVKAYDSLGEKLKLGDSAEFIGWLSYDPPTKEEEAEQDKLN